MIFVLSGYDLVVIIVSHPLVIISGIILSINGSNTEFYENYKVCVYIVTVLTCFSLVVVFTLTLERYLGLAYPLFHRTSVTKRRLLFFLFVTQLLSFVVVILTHTYKVHYVDLYILIMTVIFITLMNVRMFFIAKSKRKVLKGKASIKKYYACVIALGCFTVCCLPTIVYYGLVVAGTIQTDWKSAMYFFFWNLTILSVNSTANSLIFFWNNSVLRNEGKKILNFCSS
jgi:hypothetical protein